MAPLFFAEHAMAKKHLEVFLKINYEVLDSNFDCDIYKLSYLYFKIFYCWAIIFIFIYFNYNFFLFLSFFSLNFYY